MGETSKALGAERHGSASEYATFETKNGRVVTIRLANHNAKVSNFDNRDESEGISIVVSAKRNAGMTDDGSAHVVEHYYDALKLRRAGGKPLAEIVRSIKQALYSGEFTDTTGLAERQEVNGWENPENSDRGRGGSDAGMRRLLGSEAEGGGKVRKMSFGEAYDYDRYPLGRVEPDLAEKSVEVVRADAAHGFKNYKEARTWAKQNVVKTYTGDETGGKGDVRISNATVDKFMSQSAVEKSDTKDVHMAVLKVLPDVLRTSIDVETHPDFLKGEDGKRNADNGINKDVLVHRCYGAVSIDGKPYRVKITLKGDKSSVTEPKKTYSYEATKIELLAGQHGENSKEEPSPRYSNNSISAAKLLENVGMSYNPGEKVLDASEKRSKDVGDRIRFQFIGERGAAMADRTEEVNTRLENLRVAREMEAESKDAKTIKMATGWERGADGKWRHEIQDIKYRPKGDAGYNSLRDKQPWSKELDALEDRLLDGEELDESEMRRFEELAELANGFKADYLSREKPHLADWVENAELFADYLSREKPHLADWVENAELFAAYPELRRMEIVFTDQLPKEDGGYYSARDNRIVVNTASDMDTESVIAHELQHAIQRMEGFARGGNTKAAMMWLADNKQEDVKIKQHVAYTLSKENGLGLSKTEVDSLISHLEYEDISDDELQSQIDALCEKHRITEDQLEDIYPTGAAWHEAYRRIAGEVEARNVQERMGMTAEERRASLAAETEDVAREDQIFLTGVSDSDKSRDYEYLVSPTEMSEREKAARGDRLMNAHAVEVKSKQIVKTAEMTARQAAEKWWNENIGKSLLYDTEVGQVEINEKSIGSSLAHRYGQPKLDAITSLKDGFERAVYLGTIPDFTRTRDNVQNHYFAYPINYDGKRSYVFCRAMQDNNKNRLYVHEVFMADGIQKKGNTLQTAASKPHGGIAFYKSILSDVLSAAKVGRNFENAKVSGGNIYEDDGLLFREGDVKRLHGGRAIVFRRKPTTTYKALKRWLAEKGVEMTEHTARTGSKYMRFKADGVDYSIRCSDHTVPDYGDLMSYGDGVRVEHDGNVIDDVEIDLCNTALRAEELRRLVTEVGQLGKESEEVRAQMLGEGTASAETERRYAVLCAVLGVENETEHRLRAAYESYVSGERARIKDEVNRKVYPFRAGNGVEIAPDGTMTHPTWQNIWKREHEAAMMELTEAKRRIREELSGEIPGYADWLKAATDKGNKFRLSEEGAVDAVNEKFNEDLQDYIDHKTPQGFRFELGMPSKELLSAGFPSLPISMRSSLLAKKAGMERHPFAASDLNGLVKAIQRPIAIFRYTKENMRNLIVDIKRGDKHFLVGVTMNYKGNGLEINSVSGLFPKESHEWLKWIQDGKAVRIDRKEKIQSLIDSLRTNPAESERIGLDLDDVAKVVENFENPKVSGGNMASTAQSVSPKLPAHPEEAISEYKVRDLIHDTQQDDWNLYKEEARGASENPESGRGGGNAGMRRLLGNEASENSEGSELSENSGLGGSGGSDARMRRLLGGEDSESEMAARAEELAEKLGTAVRIIRTDEEVAALPTPRQRKQKGSFNTMTGEVTIVVPNNANLADVENTFMHEVVGHDGLRVLFPTEEKLNNALDELYRVSNDSIKHTIDRMAQKIYDTEVDRLREQKRKAHEAKGEDANTAYYADMAEAHAEAGKKREQFKRDATEEYGADLAGRIGESGFEKMSADELSFWGRLKAMLQKALEKLLNGLRIPGKRKWGDKEWSFVLHEAYKRRKNGGRPTVFDAADTEVMRRKTGQRIFPVGKTMRTRDN